MSNAADNLLVAQDLHKHYRMGSEDLHVLRGVDLFRSQTRGRCINCHEGAELTGASVRRVRESPTRIREDQALDRGAEIRQPLQRGHGLADRARGLSVCVHACGLG